MEIAHLDQKTQNAIADLLKDVTNTCGENLISFYLYGSVAGKGYEPERSNINTLLILKERDIAALKGISGVYKKWVGRRIVAPLILTPDYIETSTDVFPIEFLDIKEQSILLAGLDILKETTIDTSHLRYECEREIKGQLTRMTGMFLEVEGDIKGMERLIVASVSAVVFPLKNILKLLRQDIPESGESVIKACCRAFDVSDVSILEAWSIKKGEVKVTLERLYEVFSGYLISLDEISKRLDVFKSEGRL